MHTDWFEGDRRCGFVYHRAIAFTSNPSEKGGGQYAGTSVSMVQPRCGQYAGMSAILTFARSSGRNALVSALQNKLVKGVRDLQFRKTSIDILEETTA